MAHAPPRYRVWVGGLPKTIQKEDLYAKFSKYGPISDITIRSSEVDTYSFITYADRRDAEEAISRMDRSCAWGAPVKVNISKDFAPNGPRPRGPDGRPINASPPSSGITHGCGRAVSRYSPKRRCSPSKRRRSRSARSREFRRRLRSHSCESLLPRSSSCHRMDRSPLGPPRVYSPARGRSPPRQGPSRRCSSPARRPPRDRHSPPRDPTAPPWIAGGPPPIGDYRITIENIPDDMGWLELKDLGREYGSSVTFSRTYRRGSVTYGMLEFADVKDAQRCLQSLDGRRIQGGTQPMRVSEGDSWNA